MACSLRASCSGFFRCRAQALGQAGSVVVAHGLSCPGASGILVPQPGVEPASPALEGILLTPGPPGKCQRNQIKISLYSFMESLQN